MAPRRPLSDGGEVDAGCAKLPPVNFLLHRAFALREGLGPAAGVGAMLPDLWRMADRDVRARPGRGSDALARGVDHHLEVDRWFHRTEVFVYGERDLTRALAQLEVPKLGRFGHIGWELCLDGAWLQREEQAALALRADLAGVGVDDAVAAARAHGAERLSSARHARFRGTMERIFEGLSGGWGEGYAEPERLAERIDGIRRRVGLGHVPDEKRDALVAVLATYLERAAEALPRLEVDRERACA